MTEPDMQAVDDLCRLAHAARRLGCRAHLVGAHDDLHALLDLAGVADVLGVCPADQHPTDSQPPRRDLRCMP
jgi:hypothetical protein